MMRYLKSLFPMAFCTVSLALPCAIRADDAALSPREMPSRPLLTGELLPTGERITPRAMPGAKFETLNPNLEGLPDFTAGQASALALSPDRATLLVLTSGYNRNFGGDGSIIPALSSEYVFVYDVSGPLPVKRQILKIANTFLGIVWHPAGERFFVGGGVDDVVYEYARRDGKFTLAKTIALGHKTGVGVAGTKPQAAGIAVSPDGKYLLVANYQNESVGLVETATGHGVSEIDLRPGVVDASKSGMPGGTYPNVVAFVSNTKAYVGSQRDRELIALRLDDSGLSISDRTHVNGQPAAIVVNHTGSRAYVALDNTDRVAVIDTIGNDALEEITTVAPAEIWGNRKNLHGANTNGLALSADERVLFATNGGLNDLAIIELGKNAVDPAMERDIEASYETKMETEEEETNANAPTETSRVVGLIPTGWYPTSVAVRSNKGPIYVANGKSNTGPNPLGCRRALRTDASALNACKNADQYVWQMEKAGLLTLPMPHPRQIVDMTRQVAFNNHFPGFRRRTNNTKIMAFLRSRIKHVIYIVKENRTYDQVLGDLDVGNGDPGLTLFPEPITPNHHALSRGFVTLDAFFDSGETSNTGWNWSTAARATDFTERSSPVNYAGRGLQYDWEGLNRGINVGIATQEDREAANPATPKDPNAMAGAADVAAPDAAGNVGVVGTGYLWDAALRAGLSVRNYGFYGDLSRYHTEHPAHLPATLRNPFSRKIQVFFTTKPSLAPHTDIYFRGYDQKQPDYWRFKEWEREFDTYAQKGRLPNLSLLRLAHDHFGDFAKAIDGVNTVETEMADNDYSVGLVVEKVAHSPFADNTLIFVIEDDAQNGADHVDAHRSIALVIGPYVRQNAIVSRPFTTVNMLRTIEDVLGLRPLGINDGLAEPMAEIFTPVQTSWSYRAIIPEVLRTTKLPLPKAAKKNGAVNNCFTRPVRAAVYWEEAMRGQNFLEEDRLDTESFNAALWRGLKGNIIASTEHNGKDLSRDREKLLADFRRENGCR